MKFGILQGKVRACPELAEGMGVNPLILSLSKDARRGVKPVLR